MARRTKGHRGRKIGRGKATINSPFHPVFGGGRTKGRKRGGRRR